MATGDAIDRIYGGAVSFGRDVFHYIVTGTVFVLVCSVPLWPVLWKLAAANFKPGIGSTGIQCAVTRRYSSAGANPARQLSLQPVAVGADDGGNDIG